MDIIGPEELVFGVHDFQGAKEFLADYGLIAATDNDEEGRFVAQDGSAIVVRKADDQSLPEVLPSGNMIRKTIYGVEDAKSLDEIEQEISKDREVTRTSSGSIIFKDDCGFLLEFRVNTRKTLDLPSERVNSPGAKPGRSEDELGAHLELNVVPRTLSHIVYFVPDWEKAEAFYKRLGFVTTDLFTNLGPFMRPRANRDHHTLFFIKTPPHLAGMEHIAFHVQGPTEMLMAGQKLLDKGYQSFWGPGRHLMGSNWFWYFHSPLGCHVEYDSDMDVHSDDWTPREMMATPETSQVFLFEHRQKWAPGGGPPPSTPPVERIVG